MSRPPLIPRRIIQTGKNADLPPLAQAAVKLLRLQHPDWEYLFFDDAAVLRFIGAEFPQYQSVFDSFPHPIQRFDFFRYLAVLRFGGFYFDLDVLILNPLTELRSHACVFPFEELTLNRFLRARCGIDWEIGNYAFGAAASNPFIAAIVENCIRAQRDAAWARPLRHGIAAPFRARFEVLNTTGPGLVTRTLAEQSPGCGVKILFPENIHDSRHWHRFGHFGVHLMEASWRDRGTFLGRKIGLLWETRLRRRLAAERRAEGSVRRELQPV